MFRYSRFAHHCFNAVVLILLVGSIASAQREAVPRSTPGTEPAQRRPEQAGPPERRAPATQTAKPRPPQQHPAPRAERPASPRPPVANRGERIFIGGYFYDPFYGPYPWWPRPIHRVRYFPIYDYRAAARIRVTPREAAVYVDGFYAGIVDDFDGMFQRLLVPPGGHSFVFYREGYRTTTQNLYLRPDSEMTLAFAMEPLPPGQHSEPPPVAAPIAPPPAGSYQVPPTHAPVAGAAVPADADGVGTLELRIQPVDAQVVIDGQPWVSSEPGHFVIDVAVGRHHVEITRPGAMPYTADVEVGESKTVAVNVSLSAARQE